MFFIIRIVIKMKSENEISRTRNLGSLLESQMGKFILENIICVQIWPAHVLQVELCVQVWITGAGCLQICV